MYEPLLFSGTRWGAAKVVARKQVARVSFQGFPDWPEPRPPDKKKIPFIDTLIIETTGQGRPYSVHEAEGWWRDLAETPLDDARRVLSFLRRRGDPFGQLAPDGTQISTYDWCILQATLVCAALAWDPQSDATGVSHFRPEKLRSAEHMFEFSTGWANELGVSYSGVTLVVGARTLAAYLCAAAAASVRAELDMRRCDYCSSWFLLRRANARQCSASCRAARFNQRKSPHVITPQD